MRTIGKVALTLGLAALLTAPARAQFGRGGGMGPMAGFGVLMSPNGQRELNLTEEQIDKVREIGEGLQGTMREKFRELQDVAPEERAEKMQKAMAEVAEGVEKEIKEVLKEDQMKRYKEIKLQAMGVAAFEQEEVASKLELTDEQKQKIKDIQSDAQDKNRAVLEDLQGGGDRQAAMQKMREIQQEARTKALAVLTDEQKETWKEMTGKEFQMQPFGGPGGPGGGRRRQVD